MKRKKRRLMTIVTDHGVVTTDRPALDLPFSHPYRAHQREVEGKWMPPNHDGVRFMSVIDNESAKAIVIKESPEILDLVKRSNHESTVGKQEFLSPCGNFFMILVAGFITPDADDPERVESGWWVTKTAGPIKHLEKYSEMAMSVMRKAFE